ncbi:MAG: hypothetical protein AAGB26_02285 [Planctomycetota bacterium]
MQRDELQLLGAAMPTSVKCAVLMLALGMVAVLFAIHFASLEYGFFAFTDPIMLLVATVCLALSIYAIREIVKAKPNIRLILLLIGLGFITWDVWDYTQYGFSPYAAAQACVTMLVLHAWLLLSLPVSNEWFQRMNAEE